MCENCFTIEINSFATTTAFKDFEQQLEQQLRRLQGMFYLRQSAPNEPIEYTIYGCKNCEAKWYLNLPVAENSGCFLLEKTFQPLLKTAKKNDSRLRTGVIVTCLVVMFICLIFILNAIK